MKYEIIYSSGGNKEVRSHRYGFDYDKYKKLNFIRKVIFRYKNFYFPTAGETTGTIIEFVDCEKNIFLRRLRGVLGYGSGWTFWDAIKEFFTPIIVFILWVIGFVYIFIHVRIHIEWIK